MKFNWYQLNVVNRNEVLPALGVINFMKGGAVRPPYLQVNNRKG